MKEEKTKFNTSWEHVRRYLLREKCRPHTELFLIHIFLYSD